MPNAVAEAGPQALSFSGKAAGLGCVSLPAACQPGGSARRIVRNSTLNLVGFGLHGCCTLLAVFALARGLGKNGLGQYYTIYTIMVLVQTICRAGIGTTMIRRISQSPGTWKAVVAEGAGLLSFVVTVAVTGLLGIGVLWAWHQDDPEAILLFGLSGVACGAFIVRRFCAAVFQAFEELEYENAARVLQSLLFALLLVFLLVMGRLALLAALVVLAASHLTEAGVMLVALQRCRPCWGWRFSWAVLKDWLGEAVPLGCGDVLRRLTWQIDTLILGFLQAPAVVGIYSVAYRPLGVLNWIPEAILTAVFPSFSRLAHGDPQALSRAFAASTRLLWVISLPLVVGIGVCAEPLVVSLAGADFAEAAMPLRLLIGIACLSFLSFQFRFVFAALGLRQVFPRLVAAILILEVVVQVTLIPKWGYLGACAGSVLGELVFTVAGLTLCRRLGLGGPRVKEMMVAALAAAALGGALWPLREQGLLVLFLAGLVGTALYLVLCVMLGAIRREEVWRFGEALNRFFVRAA